MTRRIALLVLLSFLLVVAGEAQRPEGMSVYTWTREDIFAGPLGNDVDRLTVGMRKLDDILAKNPGDPDALVLKGLGTAYLALRDLEAGDTAGFERRYAEAIRLLDEGYGLDPDGIGTNSVYGGTMLLFQGRLPEPRRKHALERAHRSYSNLYRLQGDVLDRMPVHHRGEVLTGLAESEFRLGNRVEAEGHMRRIVETMADTPYAPAAERWLRDPDGVALTDKLVCKSCHELGRLSRAGGR